MLWIDQNRPMETNFLSALFEENSVGIYKKTRINKHKINNHINTFYNQKEQQYAKKKQHRRDGNSQTYIPLVLNDELTIETGTVDVVVMDRSESSNGEKLFVSTL